MSTAQHWLLTGSDDFEICAANSVISCSSNPTFLICVIMTLICGVIISAVMSCLLPVATWKRISIQIEWCVIYSGGGKLKIRWDILYKRYTLVTKVWCEFRILDLVNEYGGPTLACCVPSYRASVLTAGTIFVSFQIMSNGGFELCNCPRRWVVLDKVHGSRKGWGLLCSHQHSPFFYSAKQTTL